VFAVLRVEPGTAVAHRDDDVVARAPDQHLHGGAGRILQRVLDEIVERHAQFVLVAEDGNPVETGFDVVRYAAVGPGAQKYRDALLDALHDVDRAGIGFGALGALEAQKQQHAVDDSAKTALFPDERLYRAPPHLSIVLVRERVDAAADDRQRRPQLVSCIADKPPHLVLRLLAPRERRSYSVGRRFIRFRKPRELLESRRLSDPFGPQLPGAEAFQLDRHREQRTQRRVRERAREQNAKHGARNEQQCIDGQDSAKARDERLGTGHKHHARKRGLQPLRA
jgi:hypothetical protein